MHFVLLLYILHIFMAKICKNKVEQVLNIIVGDNVVTVLDNANLVCIKVTIWIMEKLFFQQSTQARHGGNTGYWNSNVTIVFYSN